MADTESNDCLSEHAMAFMVQAMSDFQRDGAPCDVSFRKLLPEVRYGDRATHFLHPYPGKLVAHIPYFFLRNALFSGNETRVLDPFCGSGTTLVEAMIRGVHADGLDVNPFAVLLSNTKCRYHLDDRLVAVSEEIVRQMPLADPAPRVIPNASLWYAPETYVSLLRLRSAIDFVSTGVTRDVMLIVLSATARTMSFADPRLPVPVRVKPQKAKSERMRKLFTEVERRARQGDVASAFLAGVVRAVSRFQSLRDLVPLNPIPAHCEVANLLERGPEYDPKTEAYDLVLTSPPYCGAQKYVRSTSQAIAWTSDIESSSLANLEAATIGREHIRKSCRARDSASIQDLEMARIITRIEKHSPIKAEIVAAYVNEMNSAFSKISTYIRPGGHLVMVVGDNMVAGEVFPATRFLMNTLEKWGLVPVVLMRDSIPSRGLMTRRRLSQPLSHESVVVMKRT